MKKREIISHLLMENIKMVQHIHHIVAKVGNIRELLLLFQASSCLLLLVSNPPTILGCRKMSIQDIIHSEHDYGSTRDDTIGVSKATTEEICTLNHHDNMLNKFLFLIIGFTVIILTQVKRRTTISYTSGKGSQSTVYYLNWLLIVYGLIGLSKYFIFPQLNCVLYGYTSIFQILVSPMKLIKSCILLIVGLPLSLFYRLTYNNHVLQMPKDTFLGMLSEQDGGHHYRRILDSLPDDMLSVNCGKVCSVVFKWSNVYLLTLHIIACALLINSDSDWSETEVDVTQDDVSDDSIVGLSDSVKNKDSSAITNPIGKPDYQCKTCLNQRIGDKVASIPLLDSLTSDLRNRFSAKPINITKPLNVSPTFIKKKVKSEKSTQTTNTETKHSQHGHKDNLITEFEQLDKEPYDNNSINNIPSTKKMNSNTTATQTELLTSAHKTIQTVDIMTNTLDKVTQCDVTHDVINRNVSNKSIQVSHSNMKHHRRSRSTSTIDRPITSTSSQTVAMETNAVTMDTHVISMDTETNIYKSNSSSLSEPEEDMISNGECVTVEEIGSSNGDDKTLATCVVATYANIPKAHAQLDVFRVEEVLCDTPKSALSVGETVVEGENVVQKPSQVKSEGINGNIVEDVKVSEKIGGLKASPRDIDSNVSSQPIDFTIHRHKDQSVQVTSKCTCVREYRKMSKRTQTSRSLQDKSVQVFDLRPRSNSKPLIPVHEDTKTVTPQHDDLKTPVNEDAKSFSTPVNGEPKSVSTPVIEDTKSDSTTVSENRSDRFSIPLFAPRLSYSSRDTLYFDSEDKDGTRSPPSLKSFASIGTNTRMPVTGNSPVEITGHEVKEVTVSRNYAGAESPRAYFLDEKELKELEFREIENIYKSIDKKSFTPKLNKSTQIDFMTVRETLNELQNCRCQKENIGKTVYSLMTMDDDIYAVNEPIKFKAKKSYHGIWYVSLRGDVFLTVCQEVLTNINLLSEIEDIRRYIEDDILHTMKAFVDNYTRLSVCFDDDEEESDDESFINGFRL